MINRGIAPKYTRVPINQTSGQTIESGESIIVFGLWMFPTANGQTVTLEDTDGNTIENIQFPFNTLDPVMKTIPWLADRGLVVKTSATAACTVFHSQGGA